MRIEGNSTLSQNLNQNLNLYGFLLEVRIAGLILILVWVASSRAREGENSELEKKQVWNQIEIMKERKKEILGRERSTCISHVEVDSG